MIEPKASARLVWAGPETVAQVAENLRAGRRTAIRLPPGYHHALSERLYENARVRGVMDQAGDARLIERIAEIDGLDSLSALVEPMRELGARVRLRSPFPHLFFYLPPARTVAPQSYRHAGRLFGDSAHGKAHLLRS